MAALFAGAQNAGWRMDNLFKSMSIRGLREVKNFIKHFRREPGGAWTCTSHAELQLESGRVEVAEGSRFVPGTIFMGIDIVKLLDEASSFQQPPVQLVSQSPSNAA